MVFRGLSFILLSVIHHCVPHQSGKLVQKMFSKLQEMVDDPNALVCVLIDEVSECIVYDK